MSDIVERIETEVHAMEEEAVDWGVMQKTHDLLLDCQDEIERLRTEVIEQRSDVQRLMESLIDIRDLAKDHDLKTIVAMAREALNAEGS